jgi:hypothetical protein
LDSKRLKDVILEYYFYHGFGLKAFEGRHIRINNKQALKQNKIKTDICGEFLYLYKLKIYSEFYNCTIKLFGFPIFRYWAYLMKAIHVVCTDIYVFILNHGVVLSLWFIYSIIHIYSFLNFVSDEICNIKVLFIMFQLRLSEETKRILSKESQDRTQHDIYSVSY